VSAALTQHGWTRIQGIDVAMKGYVPARLKKDALFTAPTKEGKRLAALRKQSPKALALAYYKLHGVRKGKNDNDNERRPK